MDYSTNYTAHAAAIAALFASTFTASEGAEEGALIGALAGASHFLPVALVETLAGLGHVVEAGDLDPVGAHGALSRQPNPRHEVEQGGLAGSRIPNYCEQTRIAQGRFQEANGLRKAEGVQVFDM